MSTDGINIKFKVKSQEYERQLKAVTEWLRRYPWEYSFKVKTGRGGRRKRRARRVRCSATPWNAPR